MKSNFPIFTHRPKLIYLDTAATSQKPQAVLDAMNEFYMTHNSNVNRSAHFLAEETTKAYQASRQTVADFINAKHAHEIVFTRNATESINLVAKSWGETFLNEGDEVILSKLEHHSNLVPWLQLKEKRGIVIKYFDVFSGNDEIDQQIGSRHASTLFVDRPMNDNQNGGIVFNPDLITKKTKLIALSGMSNVLGTMTDLKPIIQAAHSVGAKVLVDACQLAVHSPIDVQELNVDFLAFSGHKLYGSTGMGVLYGKMELLKTMPPFLGGGDMIQEVFEDHFTPTEPPEKFEAGTPNIAGTIGLKAAIDYIQGIGFDKIGKVEKELTEALLNEMSKLSYIQIIGPKKMENRGSVISFTMQDVHPHDIAEGLSQQDICIRAGHHCCQVLMDNLNLPATARISFGMYNSMEDVEKVLEGLEEVYRYFN